MFCNQAYMFIMLLSVMKVTRTWVEVLQKVGEMSENLTLPGKW